MIALADDVGRGCVAAVLVCIVATTYALMEIQIEGAHGWAKNLPTWRTPCNCWCVPCFTFFSGKTPLTGYHLWLWTTVGLLATLGLLTPAVFVGFHTAPSGAELMMMFTLVGAMLLLADWMWFALNYRFDREQRAGATTNHFSFGTQLRLYVISTFVLLGFWLLAHWLRVQPPASPWYVHAMASFGVFGAILLLYAMAAPRLRSCVQSLDGSCLPVSDSSGRYSTAPSAPLLFNSQTGTIGR